jgi:hypothetical protein
LRSYMKDGLNKLRKLVIDTLEITNIVNLINESNLTDVLQHIEKLETNIKNTKSTLKKETGVITFGSPINVVVNMNISEDSASKDKGVFSKLSSSKKIVHNSYNAMITGVNMRSGELMLSMKMYSKRIAKETTATFNIRTDKLCVVETSKVVPSTELPQSAGRLKHIDNFSATSAMSDFYEGGASSLNHNKLQIIGKSINSATSDIDICE